MGCPAQVIVREIMKFPQFQVTALYMCTVTIWEEICIMCKNGCSISHGYVMDLNSVVELTIKSAAYIAHLQISCLVGISTFLTGV